MRGQVLGLHTAASQQRWKMVYLNLLVVRVSRSNRFSWKKMCMQYSRTKHWGTVWSHEVCMKRDILLCLTVSIQHFTAHKISALDRSVTVLDVASSW